MVTDASFDYRAFLSVDCTEVDRLHRGLGSPAPLTISQRNESLDDE
jgi:hypothetical protein